MHRLLRGAPAGALAATLGGGSVLYAAAPSEDPPRLRVVQAQVLSRHGARTPIQTHAGVPVWVEKP